MKYKEGDKVLIHKWEDMERMYGTDEYGNLNCYPGTVESMKKYFGTVQEIVLAGEYSCRMKGIKWRFGEEMIEKKVGDEGKKTDRLVIKNYENMPKVEINGRVFVDKKMFVEAVCSMMEYDLDRCMDKDVGAGIQMAMTRLNEVQMEIGR